MAPFSASERIAAVGHEDKKTQTGITNTEKDVGNYNNVIFYLEKSEELCWASNEQHW